MAIGCFVIVMLGIETMRYVVDGFGFEQHLSVLYLTYCARHIKLKNTSLGFLWLSGDANVGRGLVTVQGFCAVVELFLQLTFSRVYRLERK